MKISAIQLIPIALLLSWLVLANFLIKTHNSWIIYAFILITVLIGITGFFMHRHSRAVKHLRCIGKLSRNIQHHGIKACKPLPVGEQPREIRPLVETLQKWIELEEDRLAQEHAFTSEASHELRSPLTGMRLQTQIAQRTEDPAQREQALNNVLKSIDRSTHLVEQLLTLSRLTRRYSEALLEKTELVSLTETIIEEYRDKAQKQDVVLEIITGEESLLVCSKDELIATLLKNLLDNALHYTPTRGRIRVQLRRQQGMAEICVEDSGPGISPGDYEAAQAPFQKTNKGIKQGAGLGLAIVKRIADLHDSSVQLDASPLGGLKVKTNFNLMSNKLNAGTSLSKSMISHTNSETTQDDLSQENSVKIVRAS